MKNHIITIVKALAIIFVVMAHAGCPTYLGRFCYMLGVSLFFMASGYFFKVKYLEDESTYVKRRFKGLYLPFVKWSFILLVFNHLWFYTGILNEQYGNAAGGVTHPLNLHQGLQALWSIIFNMSGYDQFLGGAFWFFRALLVSSIIFLFGFKMLTYVGWLKKDIKSRLLPSHSAGGASVVLLSGYSKIAITLAILGIVFAVWQTSDGLKWTGLAQGGYREFMAIFFLSAGYLYRQFELWLAKPSYTHEGLISSANCKTERQKKMVSFANKTINGIDKLIRFLGSTPIVSLAISGIILVLIIVFHPISMASKAKTFSEIYLLAFSGIVGFSFVRNISFLLNKIGRDDEVADSIAASPAGMFRRGLLYIGENTLYIFGWHILAFKLVSMLKVGVYGLPWLMVGGHCTVHSPEGNWFWILYTIVGIAIPLGGIWLYRYCDSHYNLKIYLQWAKTGLQYLGAGIVICSIYFWKGLKWSGIHLWKALKWCVLGIWKSIYSFCQSFVDTIKAGTDYKQDE